MRKFLNFLVFVFLAFFCIHAYASNAETNSPTCANVETVRAGHILVDTKEEAVSIKEQINKGASFEEMAKKYSKCPSKNNGGNLGYFGKGEMVPSFETAAFNLPIGKISDPVQTQFGWHLIKVYDRE